MSVEMQAVAVEPIVTLPRGCAASGVTDDGHVFALCPQEDDRLRWCWDGTCGEPFDRLLELRDGSLALFASPDGNHLAFMAARGDRVFVGRDGHEEPSFAAVTRSVPPVFGGRHLAYGASVDGETYRLVLDGEVVGSAELAPMNAMFGGDGERLAYVEMRGDGKDVEYRIVLDGGAGDWFRGMRNASNAMQFSPDGRRFAFHAIDGKGMARWTVDGVAQRWFNDTRPLGLTRIRGIGVVDPPIPAHFSPDGRRFAYFADVVEKGVAVIEDDVPGPLFKAVGAPWFSADSRHLAYGGVTERKTASLVIDQASVGEWPGSEGGVPVFSADGSRVAYPLEHVEGGLLRKRRVFFLILDSRPRTPIEGTDCTAFPTFSPDGRRVATWVAQGDKAVLVVDGDVRAVPWSVVSDIRFDGTGRMVYGAKIGASHTIVREDQPGPLADDVVSLRTLTERFGVDPWASPPSPFRIGPGDQVAWAGMFGERVCPVLDDEVGPGFDSILGCSIGVGGAVWWAQRDDVVYRVTRSFDGAVPSAASAGNVPG